MSTAPAAVLPGAGRARGGGAFYAACIVALLCCTAALAWQTVRLRKALDSDFSGADPRALPALLAAPLPSAAGRTVRLADLLQSKALIFVFTPGDCAACLPEMEDLERIQAMRPDIRVVGLMAHTNADDARQTAKNFGISFPVLVDAEGRLLAALRIPKTPWKMVVDTRQGRIYFQDPPSLTALERQAFVDRITRLGRE